MAAEGGTVDPPGIFVWLKKPSPSHDLFSSLDKSLYLLSAMTPSLHCRVLTEEEIDERLVAIAERD